MGNTNELPTEEEEELDDEQRAELEIETVILLSDKASADEEILGVMGPKDPLFFEIRPKGEKPDQYTSKELLDQEEPLLFTYFGIKGLGEQIRMLLAEAGADYDSVLVFGSVDQEHAMQWKKRSANGLLPMISGWGISRTTPISQSGAIIRFLARKLGMYGTSVLEEAVIDCFYETVKDLADHNTLICASDPEKDYSIAKLPFATGRCVEKMLKVMPDPKDDTVAVNFAQIYLVTILMQCEATRSGCVAENLGPTLDQFCRDMVQRPRISAFLQSPACLPYTSKELEQSDSYTFDAPIIRGSMK
jgi:glutathione S-transferase